MGAPYAQGPIQIATPVGPWGPQWHPRVLSQPPYGLSDPLGGLPAPMGAPSPLWLILAPMGAACAYKAQS